MSSFVTPLDCKQTLFRMVKRARSPRPARTSSSISARSTIRKRDCLHSVTPPKVQRVHQVQLVQQVQRVQQVQLVQLVQLVQPVSRYLCYILMECFVSGRL